MSAYAVVLLAFAQVAATLTGFIGVVFVLGERQRGQLTAYESSALFHLLYSALAALFVSLITTVLLVSSATNEHTAWQIGNGLSGLVHLTGAGRLMVEMRQQKGGIQKGLAASSIGIATAGVSFVAAGGYLIRQEALVFMLATIWALGVTVIAFVSLLLSAREAEGSE